MGFRGPCRNPKEARVLTRHSRLQPVQENCHTGGALSHMAVDTIMKFRHLGVNNLIPVVGSPFA